MACQGESELRDRAGLIDHQPGDALPGRSVEQLDEIGFGVQNASMRPEVKNTELLVVSDRKWWAIHWPHRLTRGMVWIGLF